VIFKRLNACFEEQKENLDFSGDLVYEPDLYGVEFTILETTKIIHSISGVNLKSFGCCLYLHVHRIVCKYSWL